MKNALRQRGYRWQVSERVWLIENNTPNPDVIKIKATDTFSVRAQ